MKVSLGLITIYICNLYFIDVYSQEERVPYRRFELLVTRLRHKDFYFDGTYTCCSNNEASSGCTLPCARSPSIIINGLPPITSPAIDSQVSSEGDNFVFNYVWEDDEEPRVFLDLLNVSIAIVRTTDGRSLGNNTLSNLQFVANTDRRWIDYELSKSMSVNILISYYCYGYTGINCAYRCDENDPNIECDYKNGEKYCKNGNPDPLNCSITSLTCVTNNCKNGGICLMTYSGVSSCQCLPGFEGKYCEYTLCTGFCDPDNGRCVNGSCECNSGWGGIDCSTAICDGWNMCKNNGTCSIEWNEHICSCDPVKFDGQFCEIQCTTDCNYGLCYYDGKKSFCICYDGYSGDDCTEIIAPKPAIFESGYIGKNKQTAIIAGVAVGLVIIAILVFGIAGYFRNNIKRNITVVNKAEYVVNQIEKESMLDPLCNTAIISPPALLNN